MGIREDSSRSGREGEDFGELSRTAPPEPRRVTRYDVASRLGLLSSEECKAGRFAYFTSRATAQITGQGRL